MALIIIQAACESKERFTKLSRMLWDCLYTYYFVYNVIRCSSVSVSRMTVKNDIAILFICIAYNHFYTL